MVRIVRTAVCGLLVTAGMLIAPHVAQGRDVRCATGAGLFANPLPTRYADPRYSEWFVELTANRSSLWAGVAFDGSRRNLTAAITWRPGQRHASVLGTVIHPTGNYAGAIEIAGITPKNVVVAAVKHTRSNERYGMTWYRGHSHRLAGRRSWTSIAPVGVNDNGSIYGIVRSTYGSVAHYFVVRWAHRLASPQVIHAYGHNLGLLTVVPHGDLVYSGSDGVHHVRLPSGRTITQLDSRGSGGISAPPVAAGAALFAGTFDGLGRWDLVPTPSGAEVRPTRILVRNTSRIQYLPVAAGPRGDLVFEGDRRWVRTASGANRALDSRTFRVGAISKYGSIAVTLRTDGLVHFVRCH